MGDPWDINALSDAYGFNDAQRARISAATGLPLSPPTTNPLDGPPLPGGITPGRHEATGPGALAINEFSNYRPTAVSDAVPEINLDRPPSAQDARVIADAAHQRPPLMFEDAIYPPKPPPAAPPKPVDPANAADLQRVRALEAHGAPSSIPTIQLPGAHPAGGGVGGLSESAARTIVDRNQGDWNVSREQWAKQGQAAVNEAAAQMVLRKREDQLGELRVAEAEKQAEALSAFRAREENQANEQRAREREMFGQVQSAQAELRKGPPAVDDATRAFSMMAVAFSGLGDMFKARAGLQSNQAQQAVQMVNQKAEADRAAWMQQKRSSLGAAQDSYSLARQMGMDDAAALASAKTHYLDQIGEEMKVHAQRAGNEAAGARMDLLNATLEKAKRDAAVEAARQQGSQIAQVQMASMRGTAAPTGGALKNILSDKRQDELIGRTVNMGGKTFLVPSGEEGKTIRQQAGATNKLVGIINEMDSVVGKYSWQDVLAGKAAIKTEDRAKLDSLAGQAAVAFGQSNHLGTFDEGMERLSKNIQGDPSAFSNNLAHNLETFRNTQKNAYRWTMQALPLQQAHRVNVVDETGVPRAAVIPGEWTNDSAVMDQPTVKPK